jgi:biopolymer transport protein ExbB/TolQ
MRRFFRFVFGMIALVLIAAAVAATVILLTDRAASVEIKEWAGNSVERLSDELKQQIRDNTQ